MSAAAPESHVLATTAGDLPLFEYNLRQAGHAWRVLHTGAILSHADEQRFLGDGHTPLPYGIVLWPAAIALANEVASTAAWQGLRVLELGAGVGLPGIVAATLGARVVQTDRQEAALGVCRRNGERNGQTRIEYRLADWTAWNDAERYDVILGSDVLYADGLHASLRGIFERNLAPGGRILLSDPFRGTSFALLEAMAAAGWRVNVSKWTVGLESGAESAERAVGVFELRAPAATA